MVAQKQGKGCVIHTLRSWVTLIFLIFYLYLPAQNSFQVSNYTKSSYKGGNQNWGIDLDENGNVFIANNKGLLVMTGSKTELYELPQKGILRSIACIKGKVYTGSFEEFGYWQPDDQQGWKYSSLSNLLIHDSLSNDEIWKITPHQKKIFFQSFGKLFCLENDSVSRLNIPGPVMFLMNTGGRLFIQQINGGLYEIIGKELIYLPGSDIFSDTEVKAILPLSEQEYVIGTSSKGLMVYDGRSFQKWECQENTQLINSQINSGIKLGDKLVFGTILKGVYIFNTRGHLENHLHTGNSLQNNTVLSMQGDSENNLWLGLDKGFDYIAFNSPIDKYTEPEISFGAVYTACLFLNKLYIGTNQGVYYFSFDESGVFANPLFINESQGQVWFLRVIDGELYCGLNAGTFVIRNQRLVKVCEVSGGYNLKPVSTTEENLLLQSTYNAMVVYRKQSGLWKHSHIIRGFAGPARFLEVDHIGNVWLGHSISGVYVVQPNTRYDSATVVHRIGNLQGLKINSNRVFKIDNRIVVPTGDELLQWDAINNKMVPFVELTAQLEGFETATTIIPISANKYWFVKKNEIGMFEVKFGRAKLLYLLMPQMYGLNLVDDYENIVALNDSLHLICLENGFAVLNLYRLNQLPDYNYPPTISAVHLWKNVGQSKWLLAKDIPGNEIKHSYNNFSISFNAAGPVGKKKYFQYLLQGFDADWSEWSPVSEVTYNRLPSGNYTFFVRTLTNKGTITEVSQIRLHVSMPWHLSTLAIILYALLLITVVFFWRLYFLRRRWNKREQTLIQEQNIIISQKEQIEGEIIRLSNEKLQAEVSNKSTQLANNTMALIRKNELLSEIQTEIDRQKEELGQRLPNKYYERISKLIEKHIGSEKDWVLFEKLFDQAHENFFQRLKSEFTDLTSSDLRLCAYLRLSLSSKEIAPLLNISIRGVEERRYRLRKRLKLPTAQNLAEFILAF